MSTIYDNDGFLVQSGDNLQQVEASNLFTIEDDDLMLIQRADIPYKVTGVEVKSQLGAGGGDGSFTDVIITPLSITPEPSEQLITCTTNIPTVEGQVPADVHWEWCQYDDATGYEGKKVLKTLTNREIVDTLVLPASSAGKYIGCTVTYLLQPVSEQARCAVGVPDGPVAAMSGLRFDNSRATGLLGPYAVGSAGPPSTSAWTFSTWVKPTANDNGFIFSQERSGTDEVGLRVYNGNWAWYGSATDPSFTAAVLNKWVHVVLQQKDGYLTFYLDGVQYGSSLGIYGDHGDGLKIGYRQDGSGNNNFDGYLSDVYFVEDVLPPTAFGEQFAQGWGPLDGSVVQENIAAFKKAPEVTPPPGPGEAGSPYDRRANTDQVWSSTIANNGGGNLAVYGFNGDTSNAVQAANTESVLRWTPPSSGYTKLEIKSRENGINVQIGDGTVTVSGDGVETTVIPASDVSDTFVEIPLTGDPVGELSLTGTTGKVTAGICQVKLDGRLLVDQGLWNVSQNWSDNLAPSFEWVSNMPPTQAFDGDISTRAGINTTGQGYLTLSTNVNVTSKIEVLTGVGNTVYINGSSIGTSDADPSWVESTGAKTVTEVKVEAGGAGTRADLYAIKVDGAILVDAGAQWDTSQVWTDDCAGPLDRAALAFNGDKDSQSYGYGNDEISWNPAGGIAFQTLRVYGRAEAGNPDGIKYTLDGQAEVSLTTTYTSSWLTIPGPGTLTKLRWTRPGSMNVTALVGAIELDGKILVDDTPVWNTSQVWSDVVSTTQTGNGEIVDKYKGFDGNILQRSYTTGSDAAAKSITYDFTGLGLSGDVRIFTYCGRQSGGPTIQLNNGAPIDSGDYYQSSLYGWIPLGSASPLNTIKITVNSNLDNAYLGAVEVGGKLLVDPALPWNTSQVWSNFLSPDGRWRSNNPKNQAFDGDESTSAALETQGATLTFSPNLGDGPFEVVYSGFNSGLTTVDIDGTTLAYSGSGTTWTGTVNTFNVMTMTADSGQRVGITSIKVDGKILVDSSLGTNGFYLPFNPGEIGVNYSQYGSGVMDSNFPWSRTFDGDLNTFSQPNRAAGGVATWTYPDDGIPVSDTLQFVILSSGGNSSYEVNGVSHPSGKTEFTAAELGGFLKSFSINNTSGSNYCLTKGVYVDGYLLVDDAQPGANYSSSVTLNNVENVEALFDGNAKSSPSKVTAGVDGTITFNPPITDVTKLRLYVDEDQDQYGSRYAVVNGNSNPTGRHPVGWKDYTAELGGTTLNTLSWVSSGNASSSFNLYLVEVNGVLLVNHSSIGVDASGNDNHFHDQYFFSNEYMNITDLLESSVNTNAININNLYDSNLTTYYGLDNQRFVEARFGWTKNTVGKVNSLRLFMKYRDGDGIGWTDLTMNGIRKRLGSGNGGDQNQWVDVGQTFGLTAPFDTVGLTFTAYYGGTLPFFRGIAAIEINGTIVTNPNDYFDDAYPYLDTVTDTPMCDFAVMDPTLNPGNIVCKNGNLNVGSGGGWWSAAATQGVSSGKIYYEYSITSTDNVTAGVGWRDQIDTSGNPPPGHVYLFNGNKGDKDGETPYGETWTTNDVIGVAFDIDGGSLTFYKNGVSQGEAFTGLSSEIYYPEVQTYKTYGNINFGQQPWIYGPPEGYKGLCQSWGAGQYRQLEKAFEQEQQKNRILDELIKTLQS